MCRWCVARLHRGLDSAVAVDSVDDMRRGGGAKRQARARSSRHMHHDQDRRGATKRARSRTPASMYRVRTCTMRWRDLSRANGIAWLRKSDGISAQASDRDGNEYARLRRRRMKSSCSWACACPLVVSTCCTALTSCPCCPPSVECKVVCFEV